MTSSGKCNICGIPISSQTAMSTGNICPGCLLLGGLTEAETHDDPVAAPWNAEALLGKEFPPYHIEEKIGEGGTAVVYRASQKEPVERTVAFKLIKPGRDSEAIIARFDAERQVLARMNHPSIATILDAGRTDEGRTYFVTEFIKGLPLTAFCRKHKSSQRQKLDLFLDICRGVEHAHQRGIIHRDIKPSNILVTFVDKKPQLRIIDFGIARATDGQFDTGTLFVTREHEVIGTPAYMSPEQAEGHRDEIDTRTDVYQLGVLLYELLTEKLPFDIETDKTLSFTSILEKIRNEDPRRPSQMKEGLHRDLDAITLKAMEKDRNRRYSGVADLAADIERHLNNEPVLACPPSFAYRTGKFIKKHRVSVTAAALLVLAMVAATALSVWQMVEADKARGEATRSARLATQSERSARQAEARAKDSAQLARDEAAISKAVEEFLTKDVLDSASARRETYPNITMRDVLDRAAREIGEKFRDQPKVEASILYTISGSYESLGEYEKALPLAYRGYQLAKETFGKVHKNTIRHLKGLAMLHLWRGEIVKAKEMFEDVLARQVELTGKDSEEVVGARHDLAVALASLGEYKAAKAYYVEAIKDSKRLFGDSSSHTIKAMHRYAGVLLRLGRKEESLAVARQVLAETRKRYPDDHMNTIQAEVELARKLHVNGMSKEALELMDKAVVSAEKGLSPSHPDALLALQDKADILDDLGRVDEAIEIWKEVLQRANIDSKNIDSENIGPELLVTLNNLGLRIAPRGESALAVSYLRLVANHQRANYGPYNRSTLTADYNLATVLRDTGKTQEAIDILRPTFLALRTAFGGSDPQTLRTMEVLGRLLLAQEEEEEAIELFANGLQYVSAGNTPEIAHFANLFTRHLAQASERLGRSDEVIKHFSRWIGQDPGNGGAWLIISQALAQRAINSKIEKGSIVTPMEMKERKSDSRVAALCSALAFSPDHLKIWKDGASVLNKAAAHTSFLPVIGPETNWKFFDGGKLPGEGWYSRDFDDSKWVEGFPEFGYGDSNEATTISQGKDPLNKPITTWFRFSFHLGQHPDTDKAAILCMIADDGAVIYLNGKEIIRHQMPAEGKITPETRASIALSDNAENHVYLFPIERSSFREGSNVIAAEVHQSSPSSSDMSFYPVLFTDVPLISSVAAEVSDEDIDQIFPEAKTAAAVLKVLRLEALNQKEEALALLEQLDQEDLFISGLQKRLSVRSESAP